MDNKRIARQLTPFGRWVKTQSVVQGIGLETLATKIGTNKHYLSMIIHGARSGKKYTKLIVRELGGNSSDLKDVI